MRRRGSSKRAGAPVVWRPKIFAKGRLRAFLYSALGSSIVHLRPAPDQACGKRRPIADFLKSAGAVDRSPGALAETLLGIPRQHEMGASANRFSLQLRALFFTVARTTGADRDYLAAEHAPESNAESGRGGVRRGDFSILLNLCPGREQFALGGEN